MKITEILLIGGLGLLLFGKSKGIATPIVDTVPPMDKPTISTPQGMISQAQANTIIDRIVTNYTTPATPVYTPSTYSSPVIQQAQTASSMYSGGSSISQIVATLQASDPSVVAWRPGR